MNSATTGPMTGKIGYVVLAFSNLLGKGNRLFTVPWKALTLDRNNKHFKLDIEQLKEAPGFYKDEWPNMSDATWNFTVESYYVHQKEIKS